jgi:preprotein translocase subunit YajC
MEYLFPLLILLLFIPIFLSGRRQKRQMQQMQQMQAALEPGDVIVTTSGLRGTIVDTSYEDTIDIEIADGVVTTWVRGAVREKVVEQAATAEEAPIEEPTTETAAIEDEPATPSLEKAALDKTALDKTAEKDESTNGTARS